MFLYALLCAFLATSLGATIDGRATKIVGGYEAKWGQFPYQAAIKSSAPGYPLVCGGAIINARYILTAAHCLRYMNAEDILIRFGSTDSAGGHVVTAERIILHEAYDPENLNNDIALIRTSADIAMGPGVSAVSLPAERTPAWAQVVFSGWGRLSFPSQNPAGTLRFLQMMTITQQDCDGIVGQHKIGGQNICALPAQGSGLSMYDDGGPLVHEDKLVGVASWNIPGGEGFPQIFTDVHFYITWIFKNAAV